MMVMLPQCVCVCVCFGPSMSKQNDVLLVGEASGEVAALSTQSCLSIGRWSSTHWQLVSGKNMQMQEQ
jgi:hypothetical protein